MIEAYLGTGSHRGAEGGMTIELTLPQLLRKNAAALRGRPAMREKDRGIWQPYSWQLYWGETRDFALGLAAVGFTAGDKLAVIGENRPRLYFAQLAAMCLGGIAVPALPHEVVKRGVVQVFEGRRVFENLTVEENLIVGAHSRQRFHRDPARHRADLRFLQGAA